MTTNNKLMCLISDMLRFGNKDDILIKLEWVFGNGNAYYVNNPKDLMRLLVDDNGDEVEWGVLYNIYDETICNAKAPYYVRTEETGLVNIVDYIKEYINK